jgi:hypothetical protein
MKKTLVINEVKSSKTDIGCNIFNPPNPIDILKRDLAENQKAFSNKLSAFSDQGFELDSERVFSYKVIDFNEEVPTSIKLGKTKTVNSNTNLHGVYVFDKTDKVNKYQIYFGPLIVLPEPNAGCGNLLGSTSLGCKSSKKEKSDKKLGCGNAKPKSLGCNTPKVTGDQHINFFNDLKNSDSIKAINKHNGWRNDYIAERDDYLYSSFVSANELVSENWDLINKQVSIDLESIYSNNLGFKRNINIPSSEMIFTEALLFSSDSKTKVEIKNTKNLSVFLNGFEIMYLKKTLSFFEKLFKHPFIEMIINILRLIFGSKQKDIDKNKITENNISILQDVYDQNLAEQDYNLSKIQKLNDKVIGKIKVTFAIPESKKNNSFTLFSFLKSRQKNYTLITIDVDLSEKDKFNLDKD